MSHTVALLDSLIVETVSSLVVVTDFEGRLVFFNAAAERATGYSRHEVIGKLLWDVFHTPERQANSRGRHESLVRGEAQKFRVTWTARNGACIHLDFHCKPVFDSRGNFQYAIGTGTDITERLAAEDALRQSEERFRMAVHFSPDVMFYQDTDLRLTWVSHSMTDMPVEHYIGKTDRDFLSPEDAQRLQTIKSRVMQTGVGERVESAADIGGGEIRIIETAIERRTDADGTLLGIAGYVHDLTGRIRIEKELRALNEELRLLNETLEQKVAERTAAAEQRARELARSEQSLRESEQHFKEMAESNLRLVQEVEHRVRNNLAGLLGLVSVLRERSPDVKTLADSIEHRLGAMSHVHQLLASTGWQPLGLRALVDSMLASMQLMSLCRATTEVAGSEVLIGPHQVLPLTLILVEWFTNSCKYGVYSTSGGTVHIHWKTEPTPSGTRIRLHWKEQSGPPIRDTPCRSLGSELVEGFARRELRGTCALSYPPDGANHWLEFVSVAAEPPAPTTC